MQMDSDLVFYRTTLVRTFQVVTIYRVTDLLEVRVEALDFLATVLNPIPFSGSVVGWKQYREAPSSVVCCVFQVLYQISRDPIVCLLRCRLDVEVEVEGVGDPDPPPGQAAEERKNREPGGDQYEKQIYILRHS
ncbi:hypothetical protein F511_38892 [Dorcoceras hygrometricum]|uniref:Uncharacterized protein n=1 Tax=Dorcoceras hygrometricum TaxID=472368 RepID=A0A2Z7A8K8_9LAMI|nr:hypothetical protein F511_38892 [Dorcoceras hygrometricum]